jgi:hypothetical protein
MIKVLIFNRHNQTTNFMKKILFILVFSLITGGFLHAQFNTGNMFLGANTGLDLNISSDTYKSDLNQGDPADPYKSFMFSFNPKAGYFLKQRLAVGGVIDYSTSRTNQGEDYTSTSTMYSFGPMVRYYRGYYQGISGFAEGTASIGKSIDKEEYTEGSYESIHKLMKATAGLGANFFLKENVAAEAMLQYHYMVQRPDGDNPDNNRHIISGIMFNVGIVIYILKV